MRWDEVDGVKQEADFNSDHPVAFVDRIYIAVVVVFKGSFTLGAVYARTRTSLKHTRVSVRIYRP